MKDYYAKVGQEGDIQYTCWHPIDPPPDLVPLPENYVDDKIGELVFVNGAWVDIGPRPSEWHLVLSGNWALSPTLRAGMRVRVVDEAVRRSVAPFNYGGNKYRCDAQGQAAILGAAALHPTTVPSGWTWPDINGVPVAMNSTEWSLFWAAVADRPLGIQVVVEFLHSFIDDPSHSDAVVAAIEPSTDTYWPETARP